MPIAFNDAELAHLGRTMQLLASPLDYERVDDWRHASNEAVKALLGADSAGFLLVGAGVAPLYSRDHDTEALARYPDMRLPTLPDGTDPWPRILDMGAGKLSEAYGDSYGDRYLGSVYYNDYAGPNGAHDTLQLSAAVCAPDAGTALASLQMWHASPRGRLFDEREVAVARLLFPAFQAGVEALLRWSAQRQDLLTLLDGMGAAAIVWDRAGAVVHRTPTLGVVLGTDRAALAPALLQVFGSFAALAADAPTVDRRTRAMALEVAGTAGRYRVTGSLFGRDEGHRLVIATIERTSRAAPTADELRAAYQLTPAQSRVAHELARGRSNAEIASRLGISPHTARRHTEQVFATLGARSRAELIVLLMR